MHEKNASRGFSVITVSVDPPDEPGDIELANKVLRSKKLPFPAFHLNEPGEAWNDRLGFVIVPCYFVFDRQGKWVRFSGAEYQKKYDDKAAEVMYREMDAMILKMLDEK